VSSGPNRSGPRRRLLSRCGTSPMIPPSRPSSRHALTRRGRLIRARQDDRGTRRTARSVSTEKGSQPERRHVVVGETRPLGESRRPAAHAPFLSSSWKASAVPHRGHPPLRVQDVFFDIDPLPLKPGSATANLRAGEIPDATDHAEEHGELVFISAPALKKRGRAPQIFFPDVIPGTKLAVVHIPAATTFSVRIRHSLAPTSLGPTSGILWGGNRPEPTRLSPR